MSAPENTDPPKRRRMTPEGRRDQITAAARSVFLDYGFAGTRMRDIAERAGITPNLVYVRFKSKDEIYQAAVTNPLDALVDRLASETAELTTAGRSRREVFERFHGVLYVGMLEIAPLLAAALFSVPEQGKLYYTGEVLPKFSRAITSVISDVTGWDVDSLELDVLVEGVLGLHFGLSLDSIFAKQAPDGSDVARDLTIMFSDGIPDRRARRSATAHATVAAMTASLSPITPLASVHTEPGTRLGAAERKAQIASAAREVFLERGLALARTKEIAERAGITEPFMFRLFDGKEDLYHKAIEEPAAALMQQWARDLAQIATEGDHPVDTLQAINERGILILQELAPLFVVAVFSRMERGKQFYRSVVEPALNQPSTARALRLWHGAQVRPEIMWRAIFGVQLGTVVHHTLTDNAIDPHVVAGQLTRMIAVGIRKGNVPK